MKASLVSHVPGSAATGHSYTPARPTEVRAFHPGPTSRPALRRSFALRIPFIGRGDRLNLKLEGEIEGRILGGSESFTSWNPIEHRDAAGKLKGRAQVRPGLRIKHKIDLFDAKGGHTFTLQQADAISPRYGYDVFDASGNQVGTLVRANFWGNKYELRDAEGELVMSVRRGFFSSRYRVSTETRSPKLDAALPLIAAAVPYMRKVLTAPEDDD